MCVLVLCFKARLRPALRCEEVAGRILDPLSSRITPSLHFIQQVLIARPKDAKALFRRGKARHALGQLDLAEEDLRAAQQEARSDTAIFKELKVVLSLAAYLLGKSQRQSCLLRS